MQKIDIVLFFRVLLDKNWMEEAKEENYDDVKAADPCKAKRFQSTHLVLDSLTGSFLAVLFEFQVFF